MPQGGREDGAFGGEHCLDKVKLQNENAMSVDAGEALRRLACPKCYTPLSVRFSVQRRRF